MKLPIVDHSNGVAEMAVRDFYAVKSPVFPFNKFRGVDTILGPEMRSTGEVMGISAQLSAWRLRRRNWRRGNDCRARARFLSA